MNCAQHDAQESMPDTMLIKRARIAHYLKFGRFMSGGHDAVVGQDESGGEEACSPPRRTNAPFRPPRRTGSGQASVREVPPRHTAPVRGVGDPGLGISRFFSQTAPAAELQAENAALADQLADQLARPRDAARPKAKAVADAPAAAAAVPAAAAAAAEEAETCGGPPASSAAKLGRPVAGSTDGALTELPALANLAPRPTPSGRAARQPQHGSTGRGRQPRAGAAAAGGGGTPVGDAQAAPSEGPAAPPVSTEEGMPQRPTASPASGSAGKRKRALTPLRSGQRAGGAGVGGAGKRRAQVGRDRDAGGADEGDKDPDSTPASIRDLSHLQGFALTARGTLDRLRPSVAHPRRRQVPLSPRLRIKPLATSHCLICSVVGDMMHSVAYIIYPIPIPYAQQPAAVHRFAISLPPLSV